MKPFVRSILFTGILTIVSSSSMIAQTSNGWFEQWYRAKYGRPSPTEQARLKTPQAIVASTEATPPKVVVSANGRFEQWYRAKYGRPSPPEEARLETLHINSAPQEATPSMITASAASDSVGFEQRYQAKYGHQPIAGEASPAQIPATEPLNKHQLNTLIVSAKTPAEHQRIARFYQSQAQSYLAQSKEHALEAEQSRNNLTRNNSKTIFSTVNHCEHFAQTFSDLAAKSQKLAKQHEQMAADAGKLQASSLFPTSESLGK
jgi:hypothetical protein